MGYRFQRQFRSIFGLAGVRKLLRWAGRLLLLLVLVDAGYLIGIWPQWELYASGPVQRSNFIRAYELGRSSNADWPRLRWNPVSIEAISQDMVWAVVVAEDARFFEHEGVDIEAFRDAMEYNLSKKKLVYGGSTISQQTVKNVFLSSSRDPLRKWHELLLTIGMEKNLPKKRILEYYLNVAEFGRGIYGVDAAARYYWGIPASRLSRRQAIELAATLPSPVKNNPRTDTQAFRRRVKKIRRYF